MAPVNFSMSGFVVFTAGAWTVFSSSVRRLGPGVDLSSNLVLSDDGSAVWALGGIYGNVTGATLPPGFRTVAGSVAWTFDIGADGFAGGATADWTIADPDGNTTPNRGAGMGPLSLTATAIKTGFWTVAGSLPGNFGDYISVGGGPGHGFVSGQYVIDSWWFDGTDYFYGEDPGGAFVAVDHPTPVIDSMTPSSGPIAGGTAFTIAGDGFLGPDGTPSVEDVTFDGEFPATSVVVVNQHTITGVTPAHWKGGVDVVVTLDFAP